MPSRAVLGLGFAFVASVAALVGHLAAGGGVVPAPTSRSSRSLPDSFADIVDRVNPSVVHVTVIETGPPGVLAEDEEEDPAIEELRPRRGEGSGFVVDDDGYILTNHHLVQAPARIRVRFSDRREAPATLVGSDPNTDLALLKVDAPGLRPVPLGDSDALRVGDWVCAIGNPYSFDHSVTVGVVSSKGRKIYDASFDAYIQTDAAINPGNSGGPLLNSAGEAVGINAAVSTEGQGISFAIPINLARDVIGQLRSQGRVTRGYLGVQLQELDPDLQKLVGWSEARGTVVLDVLKGGAGEAAGLERWDVITAVAGEAVKDGDHLVRAISARPPGSAVTLSVFRAGREVSLQARLAERAASEAPPVAGLVRQDPAVEGDALGLVVTELARKARNELKLPADRVGVVVLDVVGLSPGIDPLAHGDLVVEVNRRPTPDVAAYRKAVASLKPGDVAWLFVYRPRPAGTFLAKVEVEGRP